MKKTILLSLLMMLFASFTLVAQEDEEIEELDEVPSLDEILERPGNIGAAAFDDPKNAIFDLYDKVIETRVAGEESGYAEQATKIRTYAPEFLNLAKSIAELRNISSLNRIQKARAAIATPKTLKAVSHTRAHWNYMKDQFTPEEWEALMVEAGADSDEAGDESMEEETAE